MLPIRLPPQSFFSDSDSPIVVPQRKRNSLIDSSSKLLQLAQKIRKESSNKGNSPNSLSECESSPGLNHFKNTDFFYYSIKIKYGVKYANWILFVYFDKNKNFA